jgi:hypothetical protein
VAQEHGWRQKSAAARSTKNSVFFACEATNLAAA